MTVDFGPSLRRGRSWEAELLRAGRPFEPIGTVKACASCGEPIKRVEFMLPAFPGRDWIHVDRLWCQGPPRSRPR